MVRESLTMLQLGNFPADGSIITALPNDMCEGKKKKIEESILVLKFFNKPALLKHFQDWDRVLQHY